MKISKILSLALLASSLTFVGGTVYAGETTVQYEARLAKERDEAAQKLGFTSHADRLAKEEAATKAGFSSHAEYLQANEDAKRNGFDSYADKKLKDDNARAEGKGYTSYKDKLAKERLEKEAAAGQTQVILNPDCKVGKDGKFTVGKGSKVQCQSAQDGIITIGDLSFNAAGAQRKFEKAIVYQQVPLTKDENFASIKVPTVGESTGLSMIAKYGDKSRPVHYRFSLDQGKAGDFEFRSYRFLGKNPTKTTIWREVTETKDIKNLDSFKNLVEKGKAIAFDKEGTLIAYILINPETGAVPTFPIKDY